MVNNLYRSKIIKLGYFVDQGGGVQKGGRAVASISDTNVELIYDISQPEQVKAALQLRGKLSRLPIPRTDRPSLKKVYNTLYAQMNALLQITGDITDLLLGEHLEDK